MTYDLTPRADRLRVLYERRSLINNEIRALEDAETDEELERMLDQVTTARRRSHERRKLLRWAATAEFRHRLALYGGPSDQQQEAAS